MKKTIVACFALSLFAVGCAGINTAEVGGKTVVISTRAAPVILTALGAPLSKCLADLNDEGVTQVVDADGANENLLISRISGFEVCQASGVK